MSSIIFLDGHLCCIYKAFCITSPDVGDQVLTLCTLLHRQFTKMDHFSQVHVLISFLQVEEIYSPIYLIVNLCFIRYNAFIVLYPIGVFPGESKLINYLILILFIQYMCLMLWFHISGLNLRPMVDAVWLMYQALPFIKKENLYADSLPFSYYNFVLVRLTSTER